MKRIALTPKDVNRIKELYPEHSAKEIAEVIGCSVYTVYNRAYALGLKKTPEYLERMAKELSEQLAVSGTRHRYPKGHTPANKGKKMTKEQYQRAAKTMFNKGHLPANTLYDGAETVRTDKRGKPFTFIRLSIGKWAYKHIQLWERKYGKIPTGKILYCKDGNTLNCDPDNWEPVTRAESMARCRQSDETLAMQIAGRDREIKQVILNDHPELIELKRMSNQLKQNINECTGET